MTYGQAARLRAVLEAISNAGLHLRSTCGATPLQGADEFPALTPFPV